MARNRSQIVAFEASPALLAFRLVAGAANRHLRTLIAGLQALENSPAFRPNDLYLPWSRPSTPNEWAESETFVYTMALVAVVDGLDQYLRVLARMPGFVDATLIDSLEGRKVDDRRLTISERLEKINDFYSEKAGISIAGLGTNLVSKRLQTAVGPARMAMIHLLVYWRNIYAHHDYRFSISNDHRSAILKASLYFKQKHGGIQIKALVDRFDAKMAPTLSDVATMFSVAQRVLASLDGHLLQLHSGESYSQCLLRYLIRASGSPSTFVEDIWRFGGDKSAGKVHDLFLRNGANHDPNQAPGATTITRKKIHDLFGVGRNKAHALFGTSKT